MIEKTLVLLKPDAVKRGLLGRILARFEDAGLKVVGLRMTMVDDALARRHYADLESRIGADAFASVIQFMQSGPVVAMALEGDGAVAVVRKLIGSTFPSDAAPGTVRGDFCHAGRRGDGDARAVANLVHASGSPDEAATELSLWFTPDQYLAYALPSEQFTL
ncbi:MAG: nucleoside-diphosphate kinase [Propionibacteriaceae bacterium]|nr:nucleoside-diphosphate kinase [Propionibacteriaceae bacterium]